MYPLLEMFQVNFIKYKPHYKGRIQGGGNRGAVPPLDLSNLLLKSEEHKKMTCKLIGMYSVYVPLKYLIQEAKCFEFTVPILPPPPRNS